MSKAFQPEDLLLHVHLSDIHVSNAARAAAVTVVTAEKENDAVTSAIWRIDTPAELVIYPGGSHGLLQSGKPSHRVDWVRRHVSWLERWVHQQRPAG